MLMSFDELDPMMKHFLNPTAYSNMCEILDNIRAKVKRTKKEEKHMSKI